MAVVFAVWALLGVASLSWSLHPAVSFRALAGLGTGWICAVAIATFDDRERLQLWVTGAVGGGLHVVTALAQLLWIWPDALLRQRSLRLSPQMVARMESGRPLGMTLSPDLFGAVCLLGAGCSLAWASSTTHKVQRTLAMTSAALCGLGVVLSRSVGTLGAALCALVVGAVLLLWHRHRNQLKVAALLVGGVAVAGAGWVLVTRGVDGVALSLHERWLNWEAAGRMWQAHPTGVGHARFAAGYLPVRSPDANVTRYAHSSLVQGFAELGPLFVVVVGAFAWSVVRHMRRLLASPSSVATSVLTAAALGWTLRTLLDYDLQIAQTLTWFAVLWAMATTWPSTSTSSENATSSRATLGAATLGVVLAAGATWSAIVVDDTQTAPLDEAAAVARAHACDAQLTPRVATRLWQTPCAATSCAAQQALLEGILDAALSCQAPAPMLWEMEAMRALAASDVKRAQRALHQLAAADPGGLVLHQLRPFALEVFGAQPFATSSTWEAERNRWFSTPAQQERVRQLHPFIGQRVLFHPQ